MKGVRFDSRRAVGSPMQAIKVYNLRDVDELVFLDVTATAEGRGPDLDLIDDLADECFMPLTVGGGVRDVDDVRAPARRSGADKVVHQHRRGRAARARAARRPTASAPSASSSSIDTRRDADGAPRSGSARAREPTGRDPVDAGAGAGGARRGRDPAHSRSTATARWRATTSRRSARSAEAVVDPGDRVRRRRHATSTWPTRCSTGERVGGRRGRACSTSPSRPRPRPRPTSGRTAFQSGCERRDRRHVHTWRRPNLNPLGAVAPSRSSPELSGLYRRRSPAGQGQLLRGVG